VIGVLAAGTGVGNVGGGRFDPGIEAEPVDGGETPGLACQFVAHGVIDHAEIVSRFASGDVVIDLVDSGIWRDCRVGAAPLAGEIGAESTGLLLEQRIRGGF
jgi:hypothetical protein